MITFGLVLSFMVGYLLQRGITARSCIRAKVYMFTAGVFVTIWLINWKFIIEEVWK